MKISSIAILTATLTGCVTTHPEVVVIPSDREVKSVKQGVPFVAPCDGWFVPNARMLDIMNALDKSRISNK